ncbi:MAG: ABC transporter ATP-binding protein [Bryobacterales bacterium]|nr:ABC transporter ATP-binding protein [Bryobacterales bacterium]
MSPLQPPAIRFHNIAKRFPGYTAVEGIDLDVQAGRFLSVVGPSGCGKSTLLNMAAGLMEPSQGRVEMFGEPLEGINRRAGYMFQQEALLPWRTVLGNIAFGPTMAGTKAAEAARTAQDWIKRVGLDGFADRYPHQLSGGMRKRVAMAQTWITNPEIILMDEPFGALDVHTRLRMESEILGLWAETKKTVMFVTHDLEEAIALSDEVVVLSAGPASRIVGRYEVNLERPRNLIDIKTDTRFTAIYGSIWRDLRGEVLKSYERHE